MRLKQTTAFDLNIPKPFDFRLTVAKPAGWHWSTPKEIFKNDILWTGLYLGQRPVGLKLSADTNKVFVTAFTSTALTGEEVNQLKTIVGKGLGIDEDLAGFYKFADKDPVLAQSEKDLYGLRVGRLDDLFGRVLLAILLQMAPLARSEQMMTDVLEKYGTKIEFDNKNIILWPKPADIAKAGENELRNNAKLGYRAKRLVQAADFLIKNPVSLLNLEKLPETGAVTALTAIPGIG